MRLLRMLLVGTLSSVLLAPRLAAAPAQAPKTLVVTARNLTAETARVAKPGDVIRYGLVFTNVTAGPVKNIQFVDPIPAGGSGTRTSAGRCSDRSRREQR